MYLIRQFVKYILRKCLIFLIFPGKERWKGSCKQQGESTGQKGKAPAKGKGQAKGRGKGKKIR